MKTGQGLKEYALAQLGRPYWWGCFGQIADGALYAQKKAQYHKCKRWTEVLNQHRHIIIYVVQELFLDAGIAVPGHEFVNRRIHIENHPEYWDNQGEGENVEYGRQDVE